eukprot:scaffold4565_cov449-Prasinococcus_capsulatus_cf.AAC.1
MPVAYRGTVCDYDDNHRSLEVDHRGRRACAVGNSERADALHCHCCGDPIGTQVTDDLLEAQNLVQVGGIVGYCGVTRLYRPYDSGGLRLALR